MYRPSAFRFALPAPGEYEVLAFEDRNEDFICQEDEPASFSEMGPRILLSAGQRLEDLRISLREDSRVDLDFAVDLSSPAETVTLSDVTVSYGELTDIDDPRFTLANASMGMWEPLRFVREIGAGIFFLEPFDSGKTPVLFIHGLAGHPGQWGHLVESLDRDHFQPWVFFYPSGARLRFLGDELYRMVERLHARHRFTDLHVVAHSMGGLVSRKFLNNVVTQGSPVRIGVFMTISTPWGGHEASELGVKYAPAVVPSWLDMLPGSAFQEGLWETPLPAATAYYLLFSFRGENKPFMDRNNDGTVTLASELDMRAQRAAMRVCGLFEDHVSILSSENTSDLLAGALEQWRMGKAAGPQASTSAANAPAVHPAYEAIDGENLHWITLRLRDSLDDVNRQFLDPVCQTPTAKVMQCTGRDARLLPERAEPAVDVVDESRVFGPDARPAPLRDVPPPRLRKKDRRAL